MADTKFSALPAVTVPASTDEFGVNQGGTSKKVTLALLEEFLHDKGADVASAATVTLGDGWLFHITGTVTITDIDFTRSWDGRAAMLIFDGTLTLTHNATTLMLPGKANIQTAAGDSCWIVVDSGDNVKVVSYRRADASPDAVPTNSNTNQSPAAGATTYLTGSNIAVPGSKLRAKTIFHWRIQVLKTAAGTAASAFLVKIGTAGTTSDATIMTFTLPAGTAAADEGVFDIWLHITSIGAAANSVGTCDGKHQLAELTATELTGLFVKRTVTLRANGSTFDSTVANLIVGLAFTAGASQAWTMNQLMAESWNL